MDDNKSAMVGGMVFLLVALVVAGYFGYQKYTQYAFEKEFGEPLISLCKSPGSDGGRANEFFGPDKPKPWRALVIDVDHEDAWHSKLPSEARADKRADVDVVVCRMGKEQVVVEQCPYVDSSGQQYVVQRYQRYQDFVVLNPATGKRVADLRVPGPAPIACPPSMHVNDKPLVGSEPGFREFYYALLDVTWR